MKKYLLPKDGTFFKANLHCHSTVSDGCFTPEEIKKAYMEQGYSIVAYTDHDVMIDHSDLNSGDFLALRGFEMEFNEKNRPWEATRTCHICCIALDPDNRTQPMWNRTGKYLFSNAKQYADQVKFDTSEPDYERDYTPEKINEAIRIAREKRFFVTYNHPSWSGETYEQYGKYAGMNALEICNYGAYEGGWTGDYCPKVYDDVLHTGQKLCVVAGDDNHNGTLGGNKHPLHDSFGGFTMIKAPSLDYRAVTRALEDGNCYASMGPEIHELYIEDGRLHVACSPVKKLILMYGRLHSCISRHAPEGKFFTEYDFPLNFEKDVYFRLEICDEQGRYAATQAYWCEDWE